MVCGFVQGQRPADSAPVEIRRIDLRDNQMTVAKALAEIHRRTGINVTDAREQPDRVFPVDLRQATFWQALDTVAQAANGRAAVSDRDGTVRLVARRPGERASPTSYDGDFRIRAVRVQASRDLDSDRTSCNVTLELAWAPTLRPLFLETQVQELRVLNTEGKAVRVDEAGSSLSPVDGRFSLNIDVNLPGFPRTARSIGALSGNLTAIAPSKMLTYRFEARLQALHDAVADGTLRRLVLDDVVCRLASIKLERDRWTISIALDYPDDTFRLESFQSASLVVNNELKLVSKDGKRFLTPSGYVIDHVSARRALVSYHFTDRASAPRGKAEDWTPQYSAPARIVSVPIRFSFRELALP